jgi:hypothetical protein
MQRGVTGESVLNLNSPPAEAIAAVYSDECFESITSEI